MVRLVIRVLVALCVSGVPLAAHAESPAQTPPGKNLKVFGHLSEEELFDTMSLMSASLGVGCPFCHKVDDRGNGDYANDEIDEKQTAREMILMTRELNAKHFGNTTVVSCQTCHQARTHPVNVPVLPVSLPQPRSASPDRSGFPSAAVLLAKYEELTLASTLSRVRYEGTQVQEMSPEAKFFLELTDDGSRYRTVSASATSEFVTEGTSGWRVAGERREVLPPAGTARVVASTTPMRVPVLDGSLPGWRVRRKESIRGRDAWMIERLGDGEIIERYWIEPGTGALLRSFRSIPTEIGRIPEQVDYDDYREAGGRRLPFRVTTSFADPKLGTTRIVEKLTILE